MRISCIIPTRNRCQMVLGAIESIRLQNYDDLQIIVVDDGSEDSTVDEITANFPEVHVVQSQGLGPGRARNAGISASDSDIFMFLDSDDIWMDNHVQQLENVLKRGFQVAYGTTLTRDEINGTDFLIPENGAGLEGDCFSALIRWCFLVPSTVAITQKALKQVGGFAPVSCGEDWQFFLRLSARFAFGFAGPRPLTLRRLHEGSICFLKGREKLLAIVNQVLNVLEKEPRATREDCERLKMLCSWTAEHTTSWSTVQEWYQTLKQEKLI
jgi:glycosyltransferase involved in cell wall biosynthesis